TGSSSTTTNHAPDQDYAIAMAMKDLSGLKQLPISIFYGPARFLCTDSVQRE
ncbi:hypothetical protein U1Q18_004283, partial [Sarracenia purpurea var. burkii]